MVCDNRKETIMVSPIDSDKGKNIALGTPFIKNDGANTARIQSNINNLGNAISWQASSMASFLGFPISKCWCIFSIVTVDSSTKIPMASDKPAQRHNIDGLPK